MTLARVRAVVELRLHQPQALLRVEALHMPEGPVLDMASASDQVVGDMTGGAIACRAVLLGGVGGLVGCATAGNPPSPSPSQSPADGRIAAAQAELAALETRFGGRLGVMAVDTATGAAGGHRPDERFLLASTVKVPIVAAILRRAEQEQGLLERLIRYDRSALLEYAPATTANLATGMTVAALCEAAITVSDNTAANLLFDLLGVWCGESQAHPRPAGVRVRVLRRPARPGSQRRAQPGRARGPGVQVRPPPAATGTATGRLRP